MKRVTDVVLVMEVVDVVSSSSLMVSVSVVLLSSGMSVIESPSSVSVLVKGLSVALGEEASVVEVLAAGLLVVTAAALSGDPLPGVMAGLGAVEAAAAVTEGDVVVYGVVDEDTIGIAWVGEVHGVEMEGVAA